MTCPREFRSFAFMTTNFARQNRWKNGLSTGSCTSTATFGF